MSAQAYALNVATREYLPDSAKTLVDTFSQGTPLIKKLRPRARKFPGGVNIRETLRVRPMKGGAKKRGAAYRNQSVATAQPIVFDIMHALTLPIVVDKFELGVLNRGPEMIYDMLDELMTNAYQTAGEMMEVSLYFPGSGSTRYAANWTGLAEICQGGTAGSSGTEYASWDGNAYAAYGGLSRTSGDVWNTAVKGKCTDINGAISFPKLNSTYTACKFGTKRPDLGLTTEICQSYMKNKFQNQQNFADVTDPTIGFTGLKYEFATIVATRYVPGSEISGATLTGDYKTAAEWIYLTTIDSGDPVEVYPTVTGETLFWVNSGESALHMYISDNPQYQLGFEDFIPDTETDELVGRINLAAQLVSAQTRLHHQVKRILV